jgi:hypothetical protein
VRVSPSCEVFRGIYEAVEHPCSQVAILGETKYLHGTYQSVRLLNLVVLKWDLPRQLGNVAKNCRSSCRVSSEESARDPKPTPACQAEISSPSQL